MRCVFLFASASQPDELHEFKGRPKELLYFQAVNYAKTILAAKSLARLVLPKMPLVFGGHPAIVRPVLDVAMELGSPARENVCLFQSEFFKSKLDEETLKYFSQFNVIWTPESSYGAESSVDTMRGSIVAYPRTAGLEVDKGFLLGGKFGIIKEAFSLMNGFPEAPLVPIGSTGGATTSFLKYVDSSRLPVEKERLEKTADYDKLFRELVTA